MAGRLGGNTLNCKEHDPVRFVAREGTEKIKLVNSDGICKYLPDIHCVSKEATTQPPTIILTIVVRFQ